MISRRKSAIVLVTALAFLLGCVISANANVDGRVRTSFTSSADGSYALIQGQGFNPANGECLVFSTLLANWDPSLGSADRQLQTGLVRCNNSFLTLTCDDVRFVEKAAPAGYTCYPHGVFSNTVAQDFKVVRGAAGSGNVKAVINGTDYEAMSDFDQNGLAVAWGEYTDNSCSGWSGNGYFDNFQKFNFGSGWSFITGTTETTCFTVSTINSTGDFRVNH